MQHAGSVSEELTSFRVRFPVGDCAFQFRLSAEVKNSVLANFQPLRTERGKAALAPGTQTEACEIFNTGRWSRPLRQEFQAQEKQHAGHGCLRKSGKSSGSDDASLSCGRNHGVS